MRRLADKIVANQNRPRDATVLVTGGAPSLTFDRASAIRHASRVLANGGRIDFFANVAGEVQAVTKI